MTTRLLMTADAVGGVWQYATDLARALLPHGVETVIAVLGPAPSAMQLADLNAAAEPSSSPAKAGAQSRGAAQGGDHARTEPSLDPGLRRGRAGGVEVVGTDLPLDWLSPGPDPVLAAGDAIARLAREVRADLVQLNMPTLAARARFGVPTVAVTHGCVSTWWEAAHGGAPDLAYRWQAELMRRGLHAADAVVAPSAAYAATVRRHYGLAADPIAVHNGRATIAGEPSPDPALHAFTAGRLWDRVKNTAVLDRVAERLSAPFRAAGPVTGPHGETVAPRNLDLLGALSADALGAELARRPVFVSAAAFEPFGLAVLEAAQAGCALVLSDIPTFRELWDGAALFVPAADDRAIAAAVELLLADPDRRARLGAAAQARAARYTPAATAAAMARLYAGLLGQRRAAA